MRRLRTARTRTLRRTGPAVVVVVTFTGWLLSANAGSSAAAFGWALLAGAIDGAVLAIAVGRLLARLRQADDASSLPRWSRR